MERQLTHEVYSAPRICRPNFIKLYTQVCIDSHYQLCIFHSSSMSFHAAHIVRPLGNSGVQDCDISGVLPRPIKVCSRLKSRGLGTRN